MNNKSHKTGLRRFKVKICLNYNKSTQVSLLLFWWDIYWETGNSNENCKTSFLCFSTVLDSFFDFESSSVWIRNTAAERRRQAIQESKFLGGDMEHTHLVKGLDFALLQKVLLQNITVKTFYISNYLYKH